MSRFPCYLNRRWNCAAGDYRLRVHGAGQFGRTYRFSVHAGETQAYPLSLNEGRLLGGSRIQTALATAVVELRPGKADLIEWTGETVIRRDGQTGAAIWDALKLSAPWKNDEPLQNRLRYWLETSQVPELLQPAPDLDADGTPDLVWIIRGWGDVLALSGANRRVLREFRLEFDDAALIPADDPRMPGPIAPARRPVWIVGTPDVVDVDGDGTADHDFHIHVFRVSGGSRAAIAVNSRRRASAPADALTAHDPGRIGPIRSHAVESCDRPDFHDARATGLELDSQGGVRSELENGWLRGRRTMDRNSTRQPARAAQRRLSSTSCRCGRLSLPIWMVTAKPRCWRWGPARLATSKPWRLTLPARAEPCGARRSTPGTSRRTRSPRLPVGPSPLILTAMADPRLSSRTPDQCRLPAVSVACR